MDVRLLLESLYNAGVKAADPWAATAEAVAAMQLERVPGIIALGKAAERMTAGALDALGERRRDVIGLVISHLSEPEGEEAAGLAHMTGDHPVPGRMLAGEALEGVTQRLSACSDVLVLLSGGASSLAAAPVRGVSAAELVGLFRELLRSGRDINTINAVRRRVLRWGGGRLAQALHPARVHCLIVSDVMGNELAAIGSGPCVSDPTQGEDLTEVLGIPPEAIAPSMRRLLTGAGSAPTGRNADQVRVLLDNSTAVQGSVRAAKAAGYRVAQGSEMQGDAAAFGAAFAAHLLSIRDESLGSLAPIICVSGGETVVTLGDHTGRGGRCQELALSFARAASEAGVGAAVALLAAGTDGRDGPTDAAGAIVDGDTWRAIAEWGRSPDRDLATHDAYAALSSAEALLHQRRTDTNVNDLAIGVIR